MYAQHQHYWDMKHIDICPQEAFTKDLLCAELDLWLQQGEQVIIALDANENQKDDSVAKAFCAHQLQEVILFRHEPNDNGSTVILDGIWATPYIQIECGGYMVAGAAIPCTDHQGLWIVVHYHCMCGL